MSWLDKLKLFKMHRHSYPTNQRAGRKECVICGFRGSVYKRNGVWVVYGGKITSIAATNYHGFNDPHTRALLTSPFSMVGAGRNGYPSTLSFDGNRVTHTHKSRVKKNDCVACITYLGERGLKDYPKRA